LQLISVVALRGVLKEVEEGEEVILQETYVRGNLEASCMMLESARYLDSQSQFDVLPSL
jgi:hypothetical protein